MHGFRECTECTHTGTLFFKLKGFFNSYNFICMGALPACIAVHHIRFSGTGTTSRCESPSGRENWASERAMDARSYLQGHLSSSSLFLSLRQKFHNSLVPNPKYYASSPARVLASFRDVIIQAFIYFYFLIFHWKPLYSEDSTPFPTLNSQIPSKSKHPSHFARTKFCPCLVSVSLVNSIAERTLKKKRECLGFTSR